MNGFTVWANIRFRKMDEGGLKASFRPYDFFTGEQHQLGYLMDVDGKYFDFRIYQPPLFIELGQSYNMVLKFLFPDLVSRILFAGKKFTVWCSRTIADGVVTKTCDSDVEILPKCQFGSPDFYFVRICNGSTGEVKSCFLSCSASTNGRDSICGIYMHDADFTEVTGRQKCNTQKMALYCPVNVLNDDAAWPCSAVMIRVISDGENYDLSSQGECVLFKDLDSANNFKRYGVGLTLLNMSVNVESAMERARSIMRESDLYNLLASYGHE